MKDSPSYEAVTPGQRLGYAQEYIAGNGTYERDGLLYASVVGIRHITTPENKDQVIGMCLLLIDPCALTHLIHCSYRSLVCQKKRNNLRSLMWATW
jgi:hypothetical protein